MKRDAPTRIAHLQAGRLAFTARRNAERLEDVAWLAETGEGTTRAAERLGLTKGGLEHWCRAHAPHLLPVLASHEPRDPNQRPGLAAMQGRSA